MVKINSASYAYAHADACVHDVSLTVAPGERVVVLGANGSGKSTLARLVNGSLRSTSGSVEVDGTDVALASRRDVASLVGVVGQDPGAGVVTTLVRDDVAFGPRIQGLRGEELRERVREALALVGLEGFADREAARLSGGQLQRLALASALALRPRYVVLDEVTSQLDGRSRAEVREVVARVMAQGTGVLEVTHRPEEVVGAHEVVVLERGAVVWRGTPDAFFADDDALRAAAMTSALARALALCVRAGIDVTNEAGALLGMAEIAQCARRAGVGELVQGMLALRPNTGSETLGGTHEEARDQRAGLLLEGVSVQLGLGFAIGDANLAVRRGSLCVVAGPSGSGKSTLARIAAGVLEPDEGAVYLDGAAVKAGRVGLAFQSPQDQLFANTVLEDAMFGPRNAGLSEGEARAAAVSALKDLGVSEELWGRSPLALSGGEARRAALAGVVAGRPAAYVLDEPSAGLDGAARAQLMDLAKRLAGDGAAVVVVTHDVYEWAHVADEFVMVSEGHVSRKLAREALASGAWPAEFAAAQPLELELLEALHG